MITQTETKLEAMNLEQLRDAWNSIPAETDEEETALALIHERALALFNGNTDECDRFLGFNRF